MWGDRAGARCRVDALDVPTGALWGITGGTGSGKTLFLRGLLGLSPSSGRGRVLEFDLPVLDAPSRRRLHAHVGVALQSLGLLDGLAAFDQVALPLRLALRPEPEVVSRVLAALSAVGLSAAAAKRPEELSGGMRRRLALARALVAEPRLVLLDDPFTGLDPVACARIARWIRRCHAEGDRTTLVVAADPAPLLGLCDRILLFDDGCLEAIVPAVEWTTARHPAVLRFRGDGVMSHV